MSVKDPLASFDLGDKSVFYAGYRALRETHAFFKRKSQLETEYISRAKDLIFQQQQQQLQMDSFTRKQSLNDDLGHHQGMMIEFHQRSLNACAEAVESLRDLRAEYKERMGDIQSGYRILKQSFTSSFLKDTDQKSLKSQQDLRFADLAYRRALVTLEEYRVEWDEFVTQSMNQIEVLEYDRLSLMSSCFQKLASEGLKGLATTKTALESITENCRNVNIANDAALANLIEAIQGRGLEKQGVYRVSGKLSEVSDLRAALEHDMPAAGLSDPERWDIAVLCQVVKMYLRELPDPLFPFSQADRLDYVNLSEEERVARLRSLYKSVGQEQYGDKKQVGSSLPLMSDSPSSNTAAGSNMALDVPSSNSGFNKFFNRVSSSRNSESVSSTSAPLARSTSMEKLGSKLDQMESFKSASLPMEDLINFRDRILVFESARYFATKVPSAVSGTTKPPRPESKPDSSNPEAEYSTESAQSKSSKDNPVRHSQLSDIDSLRGGGDAGSVSDRSDLGDRDSLGISNTAHESCQEKLDIPNSERTKSPLNSLDRNPRLKWKSPNRPPSHSDVSPYDVRGLKEVTEKLSLSDSESKTSKLTAVSPSRIAISQPRESPTGNEFVRNLTKVSVTPATPIDALFDDSLSGGQLAQERQARSLAVLPRKPILSAGSSGSICKSAASSFEDVVSSGFSDESINSISPIPNVHDSSQDDAVQNS
ncbi:MAG: hypothetical protein SGCHY_004096 [Lobulomycetales sp.]